MTTQTFAFDESTATRILSKVTNPGDFLKVPAHEIRTRDYEKERRKLMSYDLHSITLAEYYRQSRIPRGLRCHLRPTIFSDNPDYCEKFKQILNKCSLDIILLTIDSLYTAISETEKKVSAIEEQLTSTLSTTDWQTLKSKTDKIIEDNRKSLQEKKRAKFQRDSDDYQQDRVYRWNNSPSGGYRRGNYGNRRTDSYSSDSEGSTSSHQQARFLSGRQPRRYNPRTTGGDRPGGATTTAPERMTTRSQTH
ncbi:uncharacterized protein LOC143781184 [Ranitomeya variabilis]|uniref:uncharacterized protein LOC143773296 n=1 Tax=Ranitomeya variabilis TaxID=490064 RepID=UPI004056FA3E